ncbi:MAG: hypothetical protein PHF44_02545 [Candidatus Pacebacteria bacterium]|nr:hypothetical protein [Candidatus Paceibacterota bacterium]
MICPSCKRPVPENFAFCPECGGKLPPVEKMNANPDAMTPEQASAAARSGFDTGKPFLTRGATQVPPVQGAPVKKKANPIGTIISIIAVIIIGFISLRGFFTPVRNCIGSIDGAPECSDCSTKPMKTTINGESVGTCTANPGTGNYDDQCTLNCP